MLDKGFEDVLYDGPDKNNIKYLASQCYIIDFGELEIQYDYSLN